MNLQTYQVKSKNQLQLLSERAEIAKKLGNINQLKLEWILKNKYIVLNSYEQIGNICKDLSKTEFKLSECTIKFIEYPLFIPMSILLKIDEANEFGINPSDFRIIDPFLEDGKDQFLFLPLFLDKDGDLKIGSLIGQWGGQK